MAGKRIAIACQGGGSQCAFVAGALKTLLADDGVQQRHRIVGLSGTSGGALTAALGWLGLLKQAQGDATPIDAQIVECWKDLSARTPVEIGFDAFTTMSLRLIEHGMLPSVANSPSSPAFMLWSQAVSRMIARPEFTNLRALMLKHIDFATLPSLIGPESPVLLIGALDVLDGQVRVFSSARGEISAETLLASAALPNLFPAVWVDGHAYWDGIFSQNPPVMAFLRRPTTDGDEDKIPEEIWVIQVNRAEQDTVPKWPIDIFDRLYHLAGTLSMQSDLRIIEIVNDLIQDGALTDHFRARFQLDVIEPIVVRFIRISPELQKVLDYPSKLSRQPTLIAKLMADGERQARAFLAELAQAEPAPQAVAAPRAVEHAERPQAALVPDLPASAWPHHDRPSDVSAAAPPGPPPP